MDLKEENLNIKASMTQIAQQVPKCRDSNKHSVAARGSQCGSGTERLGRDEEEKHAGPEADFSPQAIAEGFQFTLAMADTARFNVNK